MEDKIIVSEGIDFNSWRVALQHFINTRQQKGLIFLEFRINGISLYFDPNLRKYCLKAGRNLDSVISQFPSPVITVHDHTIQLEERIQEFIGNNSSFTLKIEFSEGHKLWLWEYKKQLKTAVL